MRNGATLGASAWVVNQNAFKTFEPLAQASARIFRFVRHPEREIGCISTAATAIHSVCAPLPEEGRGKVPSAKLSGLTK
jgi:hypothetical protein